MTAHRASTTARSRATGYPPMAVGRRRATLAGLPLLAALATSAAWGAPTAPTALAAQASAAAPAATAPVATHALPAAASALPAPRAATPAAAAPEPRAGAAGSGFDCLIEPHQTVELRSPVEGLIAQITTDRGAWVRRGQVLVVLDSQLEQATLAQARHRSEMVGRINQARNRVAYAQAKLTRVDQLVRANFVSAQSQDEAATELKLAETELQDAREVQRQAQLEMARTQEQIRQRTLRAPFDGYVVDRMLNPGDLAEAGTGRKPILKLAQLDPLRVEVVLPQAVFGRVAAGGSASVQAEGSATPQRAKVVLVDRVIDAASGLFGVRLALPNPGGKLPAGQRCKVVFEGLAGA